jgi:hypothetical protein
VQTHGVEGLVDLLPCGNEVIALTAQAVRTVSISASLASTDPVKKTLRTVSYLYWPCLCTTAIRTTITKEEIHGLFYVNE